MINPAGISSEASSGEKKFCVQTEFAPRPNPRITTSISLNGEVVQKVENLWEKLPQSQEDKDEIERFLRKQHRQVMKNIKEDGEKFALSKDTRIAASEEREGRPAILKVKEVIRGTQGVTGWVIFAKDDQIIDQDLLDSKDQTVADLTRCTRDLAAFLSFVSKVGHPVGGLLESKEGRMIFIPIVDNFLAVRVNPEVNVKDLVQKIRSVLMRSVAKA